jgi:hypothetical protein
VHPGTKRVGATETKCPRQSSEEIEQIGCQKTLQTVEGKGGSHQPVLLSLSLVCVFLLLFSLFSPLTFLKRIQVWGPHKFADLVSASFHVWFLFAMTVLTRVVIRK